MTAAYEIALLRAPDFSRARAGLSDTQFVTSLDAGLLDRAPDAAGLAYYLDELANGALRTDVALALVNSPEFADPTKNPAYACFF